MRKAQIVISALVLVLILTACGSETAEPPTATSRIGIACPYSHKPAGSRGYSAEANPAAGTNFFSISHRTSDTHRRTRGCDRS